MFLLFDIAFIFTSFLFHSVALSITYLIVGSFWPSTPLLQILSLVAGYFIFLHVFTLLIGIFRFFFQPRLAVGEHPIGLRGGYPHFVVNSLLFGVFASSPFRRQALFILYLKWAFYRLFGMKLPYSSMVSVDAKIGQPELIEIGKNSILGAGSIAICHYAPTPKIHVQQKIKIGSHCVIGGFTLLAPDFEMGDHSAVGFRCTTCPGVRIGNNVKIGADCRGRNVSIDLRHDLPQI